jgi:hypothetical protein
MCRLMEETKAGAPFAASSAGLTEHDSLGARNFDVESILEKSMKETCHLILSHR